MDLAHLVVHSGIFLAVNELITDKKQNIFLITEHSSFMKYSLIFSSIFSYFIIFSSAWFKKNYTNLDNLILSI